MRFFNARRTAYHTNPRKIDEVIYTTYSYGPAEQPHTAETNGDNNPPTTGRGTGGGGGGRGGTGTTPSVRWRSAGSDGETTATTAVESSDLTSHAGTTTGDLLGIPELATSDTVAGVSPPATKRKGSSKWDTTSIGEAEIFLFSYGTVVIWGMTEQQEKRFLSSLWVLCRLVRVSQPNLFYSRKRFEVEKLGMFFFLVFARVSWFWIVVR
jgi:uncharacterized Rmd1/YagE family protein